MSKVTSLRLLALLFVLLLFIPGVSAQKRKKAAKEVGHGKNVLWERVDVPRQDLFYGPGGESMQPDLTSIKFIKQEKGGHNKKYRIVDGSGRTWVAKFGTEARPETAATPRCISAVPIGCRVILTGASR